MTNELEKKFFNAFGIESKSYLVCTSRWDCIDAQPCEQCYYSKLIEDEYPKITDRILLELICIANEYENYSETTNINNIKERTLRILLRAEKFYKNYYGTDKYYKKLTKQVRTLFKEV